MSAAAPRRPSIRATRSSLARGLLLRLLLGIGFGAGLVSTSLPAAPTDLSGLTTERGPATVFQVGNVTIERRTRGWNGIPVRGALEITIEREGRRTVHTVGPTWDPSRVPLAPPPSTRPPSWKPVESLLEQEGSAADAWIAAPGRPEEQWVIDELGTPRLCLRFRVHHAVDAFEEEFWVERDTAKLVDRGSIRRHGEFAGELHARIPESNLPYSPARPLVDAPLSALTLVPAGQPPLLTATDGSFGLVAPGTDLILTAELTGPWIDVQNQAGPDSSYFGTIHSGVFASIGFGTIGDEASIAEANAYAVISRGRDWILDIAPGFTPVEAPVIVHVNVPGTCYAAYLPIFQTVQLTSSGGGCPNASYGTILAHEYFHHVSHQLIGAPEEEVEEANADIFAAFVLGDSRIGADYHGIGLPMRDLSPDVVYPVAAAPPADRGLPLSGAFWDLREELTAQLGPTGATRAAELWLTWVLAGTGQLTAGLLSEMVALDDDDGDPSNGSPHFDALVAAFTPHGFDLPLLPVQDFTCQSQEQNALLTWTLPSLANHDSLEIRRDGVWIALVDASSTQFLDESVSAGPRTWQVVARLGAAQAPSVPCSFQFPSVQPFLRGDVSGEGTLDVGDGIQLLGYLFFGDPYPTCLDALDADDSGSVDIADALRVLRYIFGIDAPPAVPFPDPAFDPTPDGLLCL